MPYLLTISLLCCWSAVASAQNQYANWVFGDHHLLSWSRSEQIDREPRLSRDGGFWSIEGSGVWSDTCTGKLILQTDGSQIMDGANTVIPGSPGLCGGPSSAQNAVIIPWPGRPNVYFVFVAKLWTGGNQDVPPDADCNSKQYTYSVVDASGPTPVILQKSVPIDNGTGSGVESIAATRAADGSSYWLLTANTDNGDFRVYRIDDTGLNTNPVISSGVPSSATDIWKFSPDGRFLASSTSFAATLFDFDNATGTISNPRVLRDARIGSVFYETVFRDRQGPRSYGLEFSPSSDLLYVMTWSANPDGDGLPAEFRVLQFDVRLPTAAEIANSVQIVYQSSDGRIKSAQSFGGHMQLGIDGRIWFNARTGLDVISFPDRRGPACGYLPAYIPIPEWQTLKNHTGFPTVIASDLGVGADGASCRPPWPTLEPDTICAGECATIVLQTTNEVSSVRWLAVGGVIQGADTADTVHVCYETPGIYSVKAVTSNAFGSDEASTTVVVLEAPSIKLEGDTVICPGSEGRFSATGADSLLWFVDGVLVQERSGELIVPSILNTSVISVVGWNAGSDCRDSQAVVVRVDTIFISSISDTAICSGTEVRLTATSSGVIRWYDADGAEVAEGDTLHVSPTATTRYRAVVTSRTGCSDTAVSTITVLDPPQAAAWGDTTVCPGERVSVNATPGFVYQWTPAGVFSDPESPSPLVVVDTTTLLIVKITDEYGCSILDSVLITVESSGWVRLGADTTVCEGADLALSATSDGGVVEWIDLQRGVVLGTGEQLVLRTTEDLSIVARLADQDCAESDTMRISVVPVRTLQAGPDTTICGRQTVETWSTGGESAVWFNAEGSILGTGSSVAITLDQSTTLYVTDTCADTAAIRITVIDPTDRVYVIGTATADVGSIVDIPIDIAGNVDGSGDLRIEYDGRLVDFTSVTGGQLLMVDGNGQPTATAHVRHGPTGRIVLQGRTMVAPVTSTVISGTTTVDSCGVVQIQPGELTVVGCGLPLRSIVTGGATMVSARYSSSASAIIVSFDASSATDLSVDLYDISGQQVYRMNTRVPIGHHDEAIPANTLATGVYVLRFTSAAYAEVVLIGVGF